MNGQCNENVAVVGLTAQLGVSKVLKIHYDKYPPVRIW